MSFDPKTRKYILPPLVSLPYSESIANGFGARNKNDPKYYKLIVVHGVFMAVSFVLLLPTAVMLSRYFFNRRQHRTASQGHAGLGVLSIVFVTIGFVTGFFAVGKDRWGTNPHHYIGLATYVGMVTVGAIGILVRRSQTKLRARRGGLMTMLHNWVGRGIILLGLANVPLGLYVYGSPLALYIIYAGIMGVWLFVFFIMEYLRERKQYQSIGGNEKWANDTDGSRYHGNHRVRSSSPVGSQRRTRVVGGAHYIAADTGNSPGRRLSKRERLSAFGNRITSFGRRAFSGETVPTLATSRPPSEHSRFGFEGLAPPPPPVPAVPGSSNNDNVTSEPQQQQRIGGPIVPVAQLDSHFAGEQNPLRQSTTLGQGLQGARPMSPVSPNVNPVDRGSSTVSSLTSPQHVHGTTPIPLPPPHGSLPPPQQGSYPLIPTNMPNPQHYQPAPSPLLPPTAPLPLPPARSSPHSRTASHPPAQQQQQPASNVSSPTKVHVKLDPSGRHIQVRRVLPGENVDDEHTAVIGEGGHVLPIGTIPRQSAEHSRSRSRDAGAGPSMGPGGSAMGGTSTGTSAAGTRAGRSERAARAAQRERELDRQRGFGRSATSPAVEMPAPSTIPPMSQGGYGASAVDRSDSESPNRLAVQSVSGRESVLSAGELTDGAEIREWRKEKRARERSTGGTGSRSGWSGFE